MIDDCGIPIPWRSIDEARRTWLIISPSKGIKTVQELSRRKPTRASCNFATVGVGSAVHMSAERFRAAAGYDAVHIPFKGGAEAAAGEVLTGRVDYYFCPIATALAAYPGRQAAGARSEFEDAFSAIAGRANHAGSGLPNSD